MLNFRLMEYPNFGSTVVKLEHSVTEEKESKGEVLMFLAIIKLLFVKFFLEGQNLNIMSFRSGKTNIDYMYIAFPRCTKAEFLARAGS